MRCVLTFVTYFVSGGEEWNVVDSQAQTRVVSLVTPQFRCVWSCLSLFYASFTDKRRNGQAHSSSSGALLSSRD